MYSHVADSYVVYRAGRKYLVEFFEWTSVSQIYQAVLIDNRPSRQDVAEVFLSNIHYNENSCPILERFDEIEALLRVSDGEADNSQVLVVGFSSLAPQPLHWCAGRVRVGGCGREPPGILRHFELHLGRGDAHRGLRNRDLGWWALGTG
jgi:hypothetical protein